MRSKSRVAVVALVLGLIVLASGCHRGYHSYSYSVGVSDYYEPCAPVVYEVDCGPVHSHHYRHHGHGHHHHRHW